MASSCASAIAWRTGSGALAKRSLAMPRFMARETSRCCAPSCRSRSIRRRSASAAATRSARLRASDSTRSASSSRRLGPSSARASASSARVTSRASHGAASSSPAAATHGRGRGGGRRAARGQVADRGHRGQPAGGHQAATGHPGDQRQQVEPELPPGRGGEPRPDRPRPALRRRGPAGMSMPSVACSRDRCNAVSPCTTHSVSTGPARTTAIYSSGVRPAAHRPLGQADDRGPPDQREPAEQDAAHQRDQQAASAFPVARQVGADQSALTAP